MGYDLNFWKYKEGIYLNNREVYEKCSNEEIVEGLEDLPVDAIKQEFIKTFSEWKMENSDNSWENPNGNGALILMSTPQFIRLDCYGMDGQDMNTIIDIMLKFDCPLYDPHVQERYDKSNNS